MMSNNVIKFEVRTVKDASEKELLEMVRMLREAGVEEFVLIGSVPTDTTDIIDDDVPSGDTVWMYNTEFTSKLKLLGAISAASKYVWET